MKFLLIDDDVLFLMMTKKMISAKVKDAEFEQFFNGEDAIEYLKETLALKQELPDVIFLDINMPVLDGWGFLKEFNDFALKISKSIPVFVLTSSISPHDVDRAKDMNCVTDFFSKPLRTNTLESLVLRHKLSIL